MLCPIVSVALFSTLKQSMRALTWLLPPPKRTMWLSTAESFLQVHLLIQYSCQTVRLTRILPLSLVRWFEVYTYHHSQPLLLWFMISPTYGQTLLPLILQPQKLPTNEHFPWCLIVWELVYLWAILSIMLAQIHLVYTKIKQPLLFSHWIALKGNMVSFTHRTKVKPHATQWARLLRQALVLWRLIPLDHKFLTLTLQAQSHLWMNQPQPQLILTKPNFTNQ
jgi:hypothetical protein